VQWLTGSSVGRRLWPVGYLNLHSQTELTRTYAPLSNRRLADHLRETDRGTSARWWLDMLGGAWTVMPNTVGLQDFAPLRQRSGLWLSRNLRSLPLVSIADRAPVANEPWVGVGATVSMKRMPSRVEARFATEKSGYCWLSLTPASGWTWYLDDSVVELQQGPGILQYLKIEPGAHRLLGVYLPPGLWVCACISLMSFATIVGLALWTRGKDKLGDEFSS
jgi:hypothetical protein